jgi:hypothetical protein
MRSARIHVVLGVALAVTSVAGLPAASRDIPITVTLLTGAPPPDALVNGIYDPDGGGGFATNAQQVVAAELRASVNFFLDLGTARSASTRDICVRFPSPVEGSVTSKSFALSGDVCTDMHWNTSDSGNLGGMTVGQPPLQKRMQIFWNTPTGTYYLRWGTSGDTSNWVTVTCNAVAGEGCVDWTVDGSGLTAHLSFSSKKTGLIDVADYQIHDVNLGVQRP